MCLKNSDKQSVEQSSAVDEQPDMRRARPAIVIHPPERDGDRDRLIAALAAAVVAVARERAACASDPSLDTNPSHGSTAKTA
jgi:hypothetical protein